MWKIQFTFATQFRFQLLWFVESNWNHGSKASWMNGCVFVYVCLCVWDGWMSTSYGWYSKQMRHSHNPICAIDEWKISIKFNGCKAFGMRPNVHLSDFDSNQIGTQCHVPENTLNCALYRYTLYIHHKHPPTHPFSHPHIFYSPFASNARFFAGFQLKIGHKPTYEFNHFSIISLVSHKNWTRERKAVTFFFFKH